MKKIIIILTAVILLPLFFSFGQAKSPGAEETESAGLQSAKHRNGPIPQGSQGRDSTINIYYFHTTNRCYSCMKLEKLTYLAIAEGFEQELGDGRVKFASINVEQDENKHFIKDYKLYTKSVIVSDVAQGEEKRWKNLQRVWELLREDEVFKEYVQEEVRLYLRGK